MTNPQPNPRWFLPTPGRLLWLLLAVEGFLWLSERFHWFAFNEHKGWTVLIAVASVGVFLLLMLLWFLAALVFRWRFQFSILSLFVLTVAVALPFSWLATEMKAAREQREAVGKLGGQVAFDYQMYPSDTTSKPPEPAWLRGLLGDDLFVNVTQVLLPHSEIGDAGLERLKVLTQLKELWLDGTQVTDAGLKHLEGLTRLRCLTLDNTQVTDAGLKHLHGLTQLQELHLGTQVTDAGLENLKGLTSLGDLRLEYTQVTDTGLKHLKGLTQLTYLDIRGTQVTKEGVKELQQALPNCSIIQ